MLNQALELYRKGYAVTVTRYNSKAPLLGGWQKNKLTEASIKSLFTKKITGIGIIAGKLSNNLVIIDVDEDNFEDIIDIFYKKIPETEYTTCVKTYSGKRHLWYHCPDLPSDFTLKRASSPKIEIRANSAFCVCPPSIINNKTYQWIRNNDPISLSFNKLYKIYKEITN